MKRFLTKISAVVLSAVLMFGGNVISVSAAFMTPEAAFFDAVLDSLMENYKFTADTEAMAREIAMKVLTEHPEYLEDFVNIASDQLDQHSDYYTQEELGYFTTSFKGEYVGIGATVQRTVGAVEIVSVVKGGAADIAGIRAGDRIIRVNGIDVTDYAVNDLTNLTRGEAGTLVEITVLRGAEEVTVVVTRAAHQANTVSYMELEGNVGYILISTFNNTTAGELAAADEYFRGKRIKRLIVDLRDNPGGELLSVINCLGFFVPRGKDVVSIEYSDESRNTTLRSVGHLSRNPYYTKLAVLVNENSASGAELFAGNIQAHQLGTVVGVTTVGKGTVQEFIDLPSFASHDLGAIKLTTAEYLLPGGVHINGVGIKPDEWKANRVVKVDTSEMAELDFFNDYREGDSAPAVLAMKQRLDLIGYYVSEINETFDHELTISLKQFQRDMSLESSGILNLETQRAMQNYLFQTTMVIDQQFDRAFEIVKQ